LEYATGGARLADDQRRRLAVPAVDACQRHGIDEVIVHAGGKAPRRNVAGLVDDPPPRHEAELAQPHSCIANVLRGWASALFTTGVAVGFRHDALLLQFVEQEPAGRGYHAVAP